MQQHLTLNRLSCTLRSKNSSPSLHSAKTVSSAKQSLLDALSNICAGNTLGYHCVHAYPHTIKAMFETLPATLKGIDKLLFESLSQLGLKVRLRHELDGAVPSVTYDSEEDDYYDEYEDKYESSRKGDRQGDKALLSKGLRPLYLNSEIDYDGGSDMAHAWDPKHTVERVVWLNWASLNQPAIIHGTVRYPLQIDVTRTNASAVW